MPPTAVGVFCALCSLYAGRLVALLAHEAGHWVAAVVLGFKARLRVQPLQYLLGRAGGHTLVAGIASGPVWCQQLIGHAGWIVSVCLAVALAVLHGHGVPLEAHVAAWWTAADALTSDLFKAHPHGAAEAAPGVLFCGNFGLIILRGMTRSRAYQLLDRMLRVTVVRGAQSAGVVTCAAVARRLRSAR